MQDCKNLYIMFFSDEVDPVWETTEESAANVTGQLWKLVRIVFDSLEYLIEFIQEMGTKAGLLVLVPEGRSLDIKIRLRLDDDSPRHQSDQRFRSLCSISIRTSRQGRPAAGLAL